MQAVVGVLYRQRTRRCSANEFGILKFPVKVEVREELLELCALLPDLVEVLPEHGVALGFGLCLSLLLFELFGVYELFCYTNIHAHLKRLLLVNRIVVAHGLRDRVYVVAAVLGRLHTVFLSQQFEHRCHLFHLRDCRVFGFGGRLAAFCHHLLELVLVLLLGEEGVPLVAAVVIGGLSLRFLRRLGGLCSFSRRFLRGRCLAPFPVHALSVPLRELAGHAQRLKR